MRAASGCELETRGFEDLAGMVGVMERERNGGREARGGLYIISVPNINDVMRCRV